MLAMTLGFYILFARDQRIVRAIESIPEQIQILYRQQNHQFNQLRNPQNNPAFNDDDDDNNIGRNPFLLNPPEPPRPIMPPPLHQEIEMVHAQNNEDESSSDEEVIPQGGFFTSFGRFINRPNWFGV